MTGAAPPIWVKSYKTYVDLKVGQQSLLHLLLTSRSVAAIVEPALYHTVLIYDGHGLASLSETLKRKPNIGSLIRRLYCTLDMISKSEVEAWYVHSHEMRHGRGKTGMISRQDLALVPVQSTTTTEKKKTKKEKAGSKGSEQSARTISRVSRAARRDLPRSLEPVFDEIIMSVSVEDLYCPYGFFSMQKILCGRATDTSLAQDEALLRRRVPGNWHKREPFQDLPLKPDAHALSGLKCLRISMVDPIFLLWWLPWFPNLDTLDIMGPVRGMWQIHSSLWSSSSGWSHQHAGFEGDTPTICTFPEVKHLKLHQVQLSEGALVRLLDVFPNLQTLGLCCETYGWPTARPARTFEEALRDKADSLRRVEIWCDDTDHYLAREIVRLDRFHRLEELFIKVEEVYTGSLDLSGIIQQWERRMDKGRG